MAVLFSRVTHCHDNICSSVFLQISIGSSECKTSSKTHWPVFVEFPASQPVERCWMWHQNR